jgi:hypothetical protein
MEASEAPLVLEMGYIGKLQGDPTWTADEVREVQRWIRAARKAEG